MIKAFENACRYPRNYSNALAEKLAELHGVSSENIIITGGSTEGLKITGLPVFTIVNGKIVMQDSEIISPPIGEPVLFNYD